MGWTAREPAYQQIEPKGYPTKLGLRRILYRSACASTRTLGFWNEKIRLRPLGYAGMNLTTFMNVVRFRNVFSQKLCQILILSIFQIDVPSSSPKIEQPHQIPKAEIWTCEALDHCCEILA